MIQQIERLYEQLAAARGISAPPCPVEVTSQTARMG
jgi:hypothetical protein